MTSDAELIAAANLSFVGSFRKLAQCTAGGEVREEGGVFAFATGLPIPLFNGCVVVRPATATALGEALEWITGRALPFRLWIAEERVPGLAEVALARGLRREAAAYPGMVLHPAPEPPAPPSRVTVVPVASDAALAEHLAVRVASGLTGELAERLFSRSFAFDPDVRLFTVRLAGEPVGASVAIRTGDVSGIYAVGTLATARRHGVGTAASWAAVAAGRAWGCDTIVLQASQMGLSVYTAMGFRTVVPYAEFKPHG